MPDVTGGISRSISSKITWNWIGAAFSLLIILVAAITLFYLVRDIETEKVFAALKAQTLENIMVAGALIAAGYGTLTFYDFFALRTTGKTDVPYRIAALAGFCSYTVGHNIGATVLTGGIIRFRIYSAWGLSVVDVAKIAFITGLTFWLGNAFLLGIGMVYAPEAASAVNKLPGWINRSIGVAGLLIILCYLAWLVPRQRFFGRSNWRIALPNMPLTLLQIAIGVADLGFATVAMYVLLPLEPAVDFITLLVIFVTATLLGFLSHTPGSLGVIETAMLIGLPQFQKEELLASLLTFRLLYFILPLLFAAILLGVREYRILLRMKRQSGTPSRLFDS